MNKLCCLIVMFITCGVCSGQNQGNKWYFGYMSAIDFNSGTPVPITGCQIIPLPQTGWFLHNEGCASIGDNNGDLLFYSEGQHVWNRNNQVMPNGNNLLGCYSSTAAAFIIPVPLSDRLFYLFTTDCIEHGLVNGLRYSIIDMCLDSAKGDIISTQKNILLLDTVSEKLTAVNHPNGKDIWLIAHKHYSDAFYAYLISEFGIIDTVISYIGSVYGPSAYQSIGQMKASPNGKKLVAVVGSGGVSLGEIFDFNDTTGSISNQISLTSVNYPYSIDFSPDNSKLYTGGLDGVNQYDLSSGTQAAINASKTTLVPAFCLPCGMQLGPDGKIYLADGAAILNPNLLGTACGYTPTYLSIYAGMDFPSFISSFQYHNQQYNCSGTSIDEKADNVNVEIYPNPVTDKINITAKRNERIEFVLYDVTGRRTIQQSFIKSTSLNTEQLAKGIYLYEVRNKNGVIKKGKVVKD